MHWEGVLLQWFPHCPVRACAGVTVVLMTSAAWQTAAANVRGAPYFATDVFCSSSAPVDDGATWCDLGQPLEVQVIRKPKVLEWTEDLFAAVEAQDVAEVMRYLKQGQDPKCILRDSILCCAVETGCVGIVQILLKGQACPNFVPPRCNGPLHTAVVHERKNMLTLLLQHGANPNLCNGNGGSPLHLVMLKKIYFIGLGLAAGRRRSAIFQLWLAEPLLLRGTWVFSCHVLQPLRGPGEGSGCACPTPAHHNADLFLPQLMGCVHVLCAAARVLGRARRRAGGVCVDRGAFVTLANLWFPHSPTLCTKSSAFWRDFRVTQHMPSVFFLMGRKCSKMSPGVHWALRTVLVLSSSQ